MSDGCGTRVVRPVDEQRVREIIREEINLGSHFAIEDALAVPRWQDISTAPKDGHEFIAFRDDQGVFVCRWAPMDQVVPHDANGDPIGEYDEDFACWFHDVWGWLEHDLTPTHWQPLPPGPTP